MQSLGTLISKGAADINHVYHDKECFTALMLASVKGHHLAVKALVEANADVNYDVPFSSLYPDNEGYTALMYAAQFGFVEVIKVLVSAGASVNHVGKSGHTALILASMNGHHLAVKALIEANAALIVAATL